MENFRILEGIVNKDLYDTMLKKLDQDIVDMLCAFAKNGALEDIDDNEMNSCIIQHSLVCANYISDHVCTHLETLRQFVERGQVIEDWEWIDECDSLLKKIERFWNSQSTEEHYMKVLESIKTKNNDVLMAEQNNLLS